MDTDRGEIARKVAREIANIYGVGDTPEAYPKAFEQAVHLIENFMLDVAELALTPSPATEALDRQAAGLARLTAENAALREGLWAVINEPPDLEDITVLAMVNAAADALNSADAARLTEPKETENG